MAQPQWITPAGSLGTIPEGVFYSIEVTATAGIEDVFYQVIAGELPNGVQITNGGIIEGVPRNVINVQGVPTEVNEDVVSKFAIRAYTTKVVNGVILVDRLNDRTFTLTITGQDIPEFITPAGNIGTFYDGTEVSIQLVFTDADVNDNLRLSVLSGALPPGLVLNPVTGLISGAIAPLTGPPGTATAGYDITEFDQYEFDFSTRALSKNYQFAVEISDGKNSNVRIFEIYVYSVNELSADNTNITADNTFITADVTPTRTPVLLTESGDLGRVRSDNFYAFKFNGIDFDGDPIEYVSVAVGSSSLPPGLVLNINTGWLYGYIPDQGATENTYQFGVRVRKADDVTVISDTKLFTLTIIGAVETDVVWLTDPDLGTINNGATSTISVQAINAGGRDLSYRLVQGSNSKLPQGLTLSTTGNLVGRVSFNTFAVDTGYTTFDKNIRTRSVNQETTFDMVFRFTVNAYAPASEQPGYKVSAIVVQTGGTGYTSTPTVTISAPPTVVGALQATAGAVTIVDGVITAIAIDEMGSGYVDLPTVTITGGGGSNATARAVVDLATIRNVVSVNRRFELQVIRLFNEPYQGLYIKAMPTESDRAMIDQLILNQDIIPVDIVYRNDDPNFGVASSVIYDHAFGLNASSLESYVQALLINHYWKNLILGPVEYAQARNSAGEVIYEAVYSRIIDDQVNSAGQSVSKEITLPYAVELDDSTAVNTVYPNSLINMRDQVIDTVGQISPLLPLWMISKQADGRVPGFTPAWVIAYVKPGQGGQVVYNIQQKFANQLNKIDFKADRYEIDRRMTYAWEPYDDSVESGRWIPSPPEATTFDITPTDLLGTYFDGGSTTFIAPANTYAVNDDFDKYILYPRTNILG